jgi:hypothetical protein
MEWSLLYDSSNQPDDKKIRSYIGKAEGLWLELRSFLEETYRVSPQIAYSKCSAQPGWNVKYQKGGKSLCTLYPMQDFFIALVVVGAREEAEAEAAMTLGVFTEELQELYHRTAFSCGGRWLMIRVTNQAILEDVKRLIAIRVKPKK